ncbi:MAG: ATP-binding protein [Actinobacteria bacterium]|nr:ATP-binding protein [Actinomycetota bacterium]
MHDLSLFLLDIIENSVRAGATRIRVGVAADRAADSLEITVEDDGPGLPVTPREALDPFYTTKKGKKTGLGLSLFRQAAEAAGGGLSVGRSTDLGGVAVRAWMGLGNVDRPPLGDVATSILTMVATNQEVAFAVDLVDGDECTSLRGSELPQRLPALVAYQEGLT